MNTSEGPGGHFDAHKSRLDYALELALVDEAAGRVKPIENVVDRLTIKYKRMADERGEV